MSNGNGGVVSTICRDHGNDRFRLMDIVAAINRAWDLEESLSGPSLEVFVNEGPR